MLPFKRDSKLIISQKQKGLFEAVKAKSRYNTNSKTILSIMIKFIKDIFNTLRIKK